MSYHLFSLHETKARKQHRCIWCGESIQVAEKYQKEKSVYDGTFQNHSWHCECWEDAQDYFSCGNEEFSPYSAERPVVLIPAMEIK